MFSPEAPLIIHDGELADVCQLLAELGLGFVEAPARVADPSAYYAASLVISSPQYLLERLEDAEDKHPTRIVIMASEARTVRRLLARSGVEKVVRRPVHPTALRLFILHCLYRGRDKRQNQRVSIGAEAQLRRGLRRRNVLLAEISQRDCRLVSRHSFKLEQRVALRIPREVTGQGTLALPGRVVRIGSANPTSGLRDVCLIFEHLRARDAKVLSELIATYAKSPAIFAGDLEGVAADATPPVVVPSLHAVENGQSTLDSPAGDVEELAEQDLQGSNRRATPRHAFERRVIALGDEAARVLLGRDISRFGMRVDPSPTLAVGDQLQIALHAVGEKSPLVVRAVVDRDDAERGLLLHFVELEAEAENYLQAVLQPLPELSEDPDEEEEDLLEQPLVVSEILEHKTSVSDSSESS